MKKNTAKEVAFWIKVVLRIIIKFALIVMVPAGICLSIFYPFELPTIAIDIIIALTVISIMGNYYLICFVVPHLINTAKYMKEHEEAFFKEAWDATKAKHYLDDDEYVNKK